jgi:RNA polymerase sigma-70 factor (ECF subfamily)
MLQTSAFEHAYRLTKGRSIESAAGQPAAGSLEGYSAVNGSEMLPDAVHCQTIAFTIANGWRQLMGRSLSKADMEKLADSQLVALVLFGNARGFEALVRRYQKTVYNLMFQMLRSHEAAADTTQETFLKAYKSMPSYRSDLAFKPWLLKIATNTALNVIRSQKTKEAESLESALEDNPSLEPAHTSTVETEVEWKLTQGLLQEALAELPARHRHVFLLRYQQDLSYAEISAIIDEPESTIKALLFRTRDRLRKLLREKMG